MGKPQTILLFLETGDASEGLLRVRAAIAFNKSGQILPAARVVAALVHAEVGVIPMGS